MILDVPFYKQTTPLNCGATALQMILAYFGEKVDIENLDKLIKTPQEKGISTIKLAIAASNLGYKTEFLSKRVLFDESNLQLDFYKKYGDINPEQSKSLIAEAKQLGVLVEEKSFPLRELLEKLTSNSLPIVLLDWNVIIGKEGYHGHFVPLIGYDDHNVYVHNHGLSNPSSCMPVPKDLFDQARKAQGTDEDVVVIYGKN